MSFARYLALTVLGAAFLVGCGPKPEFEGTAEKTDPEQAIRTTLEEIIQKGQLGSNVGAMMEAVAELKKTDSAKAEVLMKDVDELMASRGPQQVKAKAQEMLGKLSGGSGGAGAAGDSSAKPAP